MKTTRTLLCSLAMVLMTVLPAFAVNTAKVYKSGPMVLIFLGFFALLVVVQLIPALTTLFGMIKGMLAERGKAQETAEVTNKH
jgi:hypothetical protein